MYQEEKRTCVRAKLLLFLIKDADLWRFPFCHRCLRFLLFFSGRRRKRQDCIFYVQFFIVLFIKGIVYQRPWQRCRHVLPNLCINFLGRLVYVIDFVLILYVFRKLLYNQNSHCTGINLEVMELYWNMELQLVKSWKKSHNFVAKLVCTREPRKTIQ